MPTDMKRYPDNWPEIRAKILRRAGGNEDDPRVGAMCEKCGQRNYNVDGHCHNDYSDAKRYSNLLKLNNKYAPIIVLTIAHINDHDPKNCADDNLMALCQRCHNAHDVELRKTNRAKTRRGKIVERGQMVLV